MSATTPDRFLAFPHQLFELCLAGDHKNYMALYLCIRQRAAGNALGCWASVATLAALSRMNRDAVKPWAGLALQHRLLERLQRPGRTSVYRVQDRPRPAVPAQSQTRPSDGGHPNEDLAPKQGPAPGHQTGANTWPLFDGYELDPRNYKPGSRKELILSSVSNARKLAPSDLAAVPDDDPEICPPDRAPVLVPLPAERDDLAMGAARLSVIAAVKAGLPVVIGAARMPTRSRPLQPADFVAYNALPTALVVAFHRTYADLSSAASQEARRRRRELQGDDPEPAPAGGPPKLALVSEPDAAARRLPLPVAELPPALRPIADRIETYWLARNGPRNRAVFLALLEELELVQRAAGCDSVVELLRQGLQAGWPALNGRSWLRRQSAQAAPQAAALPLMNSGAYQLFRSP